jgi:hypothetical protein
MILASDSTVQVQDRFVVGELSIALEFRGWKWDAEEKFSVFLCDAVGHITHPLIDFYTVLLLI